MSMPTVSVVMPFYNDVVYLPEAIASVLGQTYRDWELILADDGSTDGSSALARDYVRSDPDRIRIVEHAGRDNRGTGPTRNIGIAAANGDYVAFLDSDDVWESCKLAEQIEIFERFPSVGLVAGATTYWFSWSSETDQSDRRRHVGAPHDQVIDPPGLMPILYPLGKGVSPSASGIMVRRVILDRVGRFEDGFRHLYEDQALLVKLYLDTPAYFSLHAWDRYRMHAGSMTHAISSSDYHAVRRSFLAWLEGYLDETGIEDPVVRQALQRAWWPYRHPRAAALRKAGGRAFARSRSLVRKYRAVGAQNR